MISRVETSNLVSIRFFMELHEYCVPLNFSSGICFCVITQNKSDFDFIDVLSVLFIREDL